MLLAPLFVFAQNASLPNAGITPDSPWFFLDRLGESLQEFFTFNPTAKAHLKISFAAERISEIKVMLEDKGVNAKGLDVAQSLLQQHLSDAAGIIADQKSKGNDVSELAKELNDEFDQSKSELDSTFSDQKLSLENQKEDLQKQIEAAKKAGDSAKVESLTQQLNQVKDQIQLLGEKQSEVQDKVDSEVEKIANDESQSGKEEEAKQQIQEAEKKLVEVTSELQKDGIQIPSTLLADFNTYLEKAKSAFASGDYINAEIYAKEAKAAIENAKEQAKNANEELKQQSEQDKQIQEQQTEQQKQQIEQQTEQQKQEQEQQNETQKQQSEIH